MKKSIIIIALIIPLILNARDFGRRHDKFSQHREDYEIAFQDLDLTDAQREEIGDLRTDFRKANIQREADLKLAYIELHELMRNEETGKNLDSAIDKVNQLKSEIFKARIKNRLEVQKILTEEQKDKLKSMNRKRMHRQDTDGMGCGHDDCDKHSRRNFGKQRSFWGQ
jgi:Spy/CpxP family protein refolding chaperone